MQQPMSKGSPTRGIAIRKTGDWHCARRVFVRPATSWGALFFREGRLAATALECNAVSNSRNNSRNLSKDLMKWRRFSRYYLPVLERIQIGNAVEMLLKPIEKQRDSFEILQRLRHLLVFLDDSIAALLHLVGDEVPRLRQLAILFLEFPVGFRLGKLDEVFGASR